MKIQQRSDTYQPGGLKIHERRLRPLKLHVSQRLDRGNIKVAF
jgi:hypothetical protein